MPMRIGKSNRPARQPESELNARSKTGIATSNAMAITRLPLGNSDTQPLPLSAQALNSPFHDVPSALLGNITKFLPQQQLNLALTAIAVKEGSLANHDPRVLIRALKQAADGFQEEIDRIESHDNPDADEQRRLLHARIQVQRCEEQISQSQAPASSSPKHYAGSDPTKS
jgi:hypothetical protein